MTPRPERTPSPERHADQEYVNATLAVINQATSIAKQASQASYSEPQQILDFLRPRMLLARPGPTKDQIKPLRHSGHREPVTLIPTFSDDVIPFIGTHPKARPGQTTAKMGAFIETGSKSMVLTDIDKRPRFDSALAFLHEGRHMWHLVDPTVRKETPREEEANGWLLNLRLCEIVGRDVWRQVVDLEKGKLREHFQGRGKKQVDIFAASTQAYRELNVPFGATNDAGIELNRSMLVGMQASIELLQEEDPMNYGSFEAAAQFKTGQFYDWAKRKTQ